MRVLVFGGKGFLGRQFLQIFPGASVPEIDITDAAAVTRTLDEVRPDLVINAVGRTGSPNVDWCEDHKAETIRSNLTGPLVLLEACRQRGIYWVHLSTGCIYQGDNGGRGFAESDEPNFEGSFYARTKIWCERALRELSSPVNGRGGILILRLRMPFDSTDSPKNLIVKLRRFPRVLDVENSITSLADFLAASEKLIVRRATGIYNVVNAGTISPYHIMELYRALVDPQHSCERLLLSDLSQVVRAGRSNCILSTGKLEGEGIHLRPVEEAVRESLLQMKIFAAQREKSDKMNTSFVQ